MKRYDPLTYRFPRTTEQAFGDYCDPIESPTKRPANKFWRAILLFCIIFGLMFFANKNAWAQFYSGNELLQRMDANESTHQMLALGYVAGVVDVTRGEYHCAPNSVTLGQVRDLTHNAIRKDPATRHLNGSVLVTLVLMEVWPCEKKGNNL